MTGPGRYRYRGNDFTPIKRIDVKPISITIKGGKSPWTYTLDEPEQGSVAVVLGLGQVTWCANAPAKPSTSVPSKNDRVDKFVSLSNAPPPVTCPASP